MKKILFLTAMLCGAISANAQFNLQLHGDLGSALYPDAESNRQLFTVTAEFFKADRMGSTYLFIDMDYRSNGSSPKDGTTGPIGAYWEFSREFTFAKIKNSNHSFAAHLEYDGGLNLFGAFQQAALVGPSWNWHSDNFSKTFSLQVLYKQFFAHQGYDAVSSFQITPVWGINFADGLCTFSGFADLWYGYVPSGKKDLVFLTEPQFWFNVYGRERQSNRFSIGTEWEISNNFIYGNSSKTFYINPTLALKYTF